MRFLAPAFLWGLLAVAVPIVLHLLLRRRVPILLFPLTRLVARAERSRQPRRRLNRVLLLVARALMLSLLALALAQLTLGGAGVVSAAGPVAAVVVVDDSMSMQARGPNGKTAFEIGRSLADDVLASLPSGSLATVIAASSPDETKALELSPDPSMARERLRSIEPTLLHVELAPALGAAMRTLASTQLSDRRIVLVTDLARHAFAGTRLTPIDGPMPTLQVIVPFPSAPRANRSVAGLDSTPLADGRLLVISRVGASGADAGDAASARPDVSMELSVGAIAGPMRLAGRARLVTGTGAAAERRFEVAAPPEGLGRTKLALEEDDLPADDVRWAVHDVAGRPRVLVVDGDPQNLSFGSETFYLEKALAPGVGLDVDAELTIVPEITGESFADRSVVVLANVPELSEERTRALTAAVRAGTGLVVAVGNRIDQAVYNGRLAPLLPATLGPVEQRAKPETIDATGPFKLPRVTVRTACRLEPLPEATTLMRLADGAPLLVEGRVGSGRVLLLGTTLDRDWTDLPISPYFLAFLREALERTAPRHRRQALPPVNVGAEVDLGHALAEIRAGDTPLTVRTPDGSASTLPSDGIFRATETPGAYAVEQAGAAVAAFAVVTDPVESDLTRLGLDEVATMTAGALEVGGTREGTTATGGGLAAWKGLLAALVALAGLEAFFARRAS